MCLSKDRFFRSMPSIILAQVFSLEGEKEENLFFETCLPFAFFRENEKTASKQG